MKEDTFQLWVLIAFAWICWLLLTMPKAPAAPCTYYGMQPHTKVAVDPGRNQVTYICGVKR